MRAGLPFSIPTLNKMRHSGKRKVASQSVNISTRHENTPFTLPFIYLLIYLCGRISKTKIQ